VDLGGKNYVNAAVQAAGHPPARAQSLHEEIIRENRGEGARDPEAG